MMQVNTSVTKSLPTRERGLKFDYIGIAACADNVAPYAGAWVEIVQVLSRQSVYNVAPYAGAWVEIYLQRP